ncbi:hypothetical protein KDW98_27225, partial [Burkholderia vietnamiensis]
QYAHRDHLCIPCSKIEQGIQSRGSKFDENYSLRWVSSAWTSTASELLLKGRIILGQIVRRPLQPDLDLLHVAAVVRAHAAL